MKMGSSSEITSSQQAPKGQLGASKHPVDQVKAEEFPQTRSYSFSHFIGLGGVDKKASQSASKPNLHHPEDCDGMSMASDSGVSDTSHTTDNSVIEAVPQAALYNSGMRKNFSHNDVGSLKTHQPDTQYRLPNFMLWNWLKHQGYNVSDHTWHKDVPQISEVQPSAEVSANVSAHVSAPKQELNHGSATVSPPIVAVIRPKPLIKMRDLNAIIPNGW